MGRSVPISLALCVALRGSDPGHTQSQTFCLTSLTNFRFRGKALLHAFTLIITDDHSKPGSDSPLFSHSRDLSNSERGEKPTHLRSYCYFVQNNPRISLCSQAPHCSFIEESHAKISFHLREIIGTKYSLEATELGRPGPASQATHPSGQAGGPESPSPCSSTPNPLPGLKEVKLEETILGLLSAFRSHILCYSPLKKLSAP